MALAGTGEKIIGGGNESVRVIYIYSKTKLFNSACGEGLTSRIAHNVGEAAALVEAGFEFMTFGEYNDGGKIFRKRK